MDARLSTKKMADAQNAKSAGMTKRKVIPECFNRESRKTD
jgi:prolyl-tRNA editing enzyme YbaK/EbsC (Cys-tRNA(Pro) deacylase)